MSLSNPANNVTTNSLKQVSDESLILAAKEIRVDGVK
jgi:hypothetical protein